MWLSVPLVWMKSMCCTIRVVGLWLASPSGNGSEGESGMKNDAVPSQGWSPPHEWMNNEQQPLCAACTHTRTHTEMYACVWIEDTTVKPFSDAQRWELLIIVPKYMQSTDWRQFEEWQRHRCKYLCLFRWLEEKLSPTLTPLKGSKCSLFCFVF